MVPDYVSTDADLLATGYATPELKERLTPPDWQEVTTEAGPWTPWHREAWAHILRHLASLPDPIEEADLADPYQLTPIAIHYVLYLAFLAGGDKEMAEHHLRQYKQQLADIRIELIGDTEGDGTANAWAYSIELERG
jgi:hypothetical protein